MTAMNPFLALLALFAIALHVAGELQAADEKAPAPELTGAALLDGLKTKQGEELAAFIELVTRCDKSRLNDDELDAIIEQLVIIEKSDPYERPPGPKSLRDTPVPLNRWAAARAIFYTRFSKVANSLAKLPLEERVAKAIEGMEHPPAVFRGTSTVMLYANELIRAGRDAVPFIIQHKPEEPYQRRGIVGALASLGDPRGVDYIIEVLKTPGDRFRFERPVAAEALAKFNEKKVITALVDALLDQTQQEIDRHRRPRVEDNQGRVPYIGRYFSVQHAAAGSLTALTGRDWGLLFNEDHRAWSEWLSAGQPEKFSPSGIARADGEVEKLITSLFHRYMSARPNPWQPQNSLASADGIQALAADLKPLGPRVVPFLAKECHARIAETPPWKKELRNWTANLLHALEWNEARDAAKNLAN